QARFSMLRLRLSVAKIAWALRNRTLPFVGYFQTSADRSALIDYAGVDVAKLAAERAEEARGIYEREFRKISREEWNACIDRIERAVARIQGRGGCVVFLRCVTSGELKKIEDLCYPREQFWDVLARRTTAATLHFEDVPAMATLQCGDGSHLD